MSQPPIFGLVNDQYNSIECNFYATLGGAAYSAALYSAFTGQFYATGGAALVGGAAELAAQLAGCNTPPPPSSFIPSAVGGCWKCLDTSTGHDVVHLRNGQQINAYASPFFEITKATFIEGTPSLWDLAGVGPNGPVPTYGIYGEPGDTFRLACECDPSYTPLPPYNPGDPISGPYTIVEGTCNWTIQAADSFVDDYGRFHVYYTITADNEACGGPFSFWSSDGGPEYVPVSPDGPTPPGPTPPSRDFDEIVRLLEEIKNCSCHEPNPPLEGSWISTRWVSDSPSANSKTALRKLFRYRSKSTRTPEELQAYWSSFTWSAGPVLVIHHGAWWGNPQVWAASEEEGKRVIRFAAGEAGIDPDLVGKWSLGTSSSPRYGMSGNMRLAEEFGEQWVTRRDGPNGTPLLDPDP